MVLSASKTKVLDRVCRWRSRYAKNLKPKKTYWSAFQAKRLYVSNHVNHAVVECIGLIG